MERSIKDHREKSRERRFRLEYKWTALSCTSLGALLASINGSSLIVALPTLLRELHTGLFALVWVLLSYLLTQTIFTIVAGRIADMFGRKKLYVGGFALFTVVSLLAGFLDLMPLATLLSRSGSRLLRVWSLRRTGGDLRS